MAEPVRELKSDEVVDILEDREQLKQDVILDALDKIERAAFQKSLTYPKFSSGHLMQREVVIVAEIWNVGEAIDYLSSADKLPDQFYHVTLFDSMMYPIANVNLGRLMSSGRYMLLKNIKEDKFRIIPVFQDEADANLYRVIWREVLVGFVNGGVFAILMGTVGILWFCLLELGYKIGTEMVLNLVIAGFAGISALVLLDRVGIDLALASGGFVTAVTDIVGFFATLGFADVILV